MRNSFIVLFALFIIESASTHRLFATDHSSVSSKISKVAGFVSISTGPPYLLLVLYEASTVAKYPLVDIE